MLKELLKRYHNLSVCEKDLEAAVNTLIRCYESGGKVLTCADADHIVGELMKGFLKKRPLPSKAKQAMLARYPDLDAALLEKLQAGLPALSLCSLTALNTAVCNDIDPALIYAQSLQIIGKPGDVLICISTSGNAANVYTAAQIAKALGISVIALTGRTGGKLLDAADICIRAPETETFQVQELHLPVYHYLCAAVEAHFFPI